MKTHPILISKRSQHETVYPCWLNRCGPQPPPLRRAATKLLMETINQYVGELKDTLSKPRLAVTQVLNLGLVVFSALMAWKGLIVTTGSVCPIVVVLSGSMEPAFQRGDILFLTMVDEHLVPQEKPNDFLRQVFCAASFVSAVDNENDERQLQAQSRSKSESATSSGAFLVLPQKTMSMLSPPLTSAGFVI